MYVCRGSLFKKARCSRKICLNVSGVTVLSCRTLAECSIAFLTVLIFVCFLANSEIGSGHDTKFNERSPAGKGQSHVSLNLKKQVSNEKRPTRKQMFFDGVTQNKIKATEQGKKADALNHVVPGVGKDLNSDTMERVNSFYNELSNNLRINGHKFNPSNALSLGQTDNGRLLPTNGFDFAPQMAQNDGTNTNLGNSLPIQLTFGPHGALARPMGQVQTQQDSSQTLPQNNGQNALNVNQQEMTQGMLDKLMYEGMASVQGEQGGLKNMADVRPTGTGFGMKPLGAGATGFQGMLNGNSLSTLQATRPAMSNSLYGMSNVNGLFQTPANFFGRGIITKAVGTPDSHGRKQLALAKSSFPKEGHLREISLPKKENMKGAEVLEKTKDAHDKARKRYKADSRHNSNTDFLAKPRHKLQLRHKQ